MEKPIVMFGTGAFCDLISYNIIHGLKREIAAYTVDSEYLLKSEHNGIPVYAFEDIERRFPPQNYEFVVGVGGSQMTQIRKKKHFAAKEKGYTITNIIHPHAEICCISMGEGNIALQTSVLAPYSVIGDGNVFVPFSYVCHHVKVGDFNYFGPGALTTGYVEVRNECFLGANCTVKNKVIVADRTFVGAGVFLKYDSQPGDIFKAITIRAAK